MKMLIPFFALLTVSFSLLANDDELAFAADVEQTDRFHTVISFRNASAPVRITVFNDTDGIVLSEQSTATDFQTELDYLGLPAGAYTVLVETENKMVTKQFVIRKKSIDISLTLMNEDDGILLKQNVSADAIQDTITAQNLSNGKYLIVMEDENGIIEGKPLYIK